MLADCLPGLDCIISGFSIDEMKKERRIHKKKHPKVFHFITTTTRIELTYEHQMKRRKHKEHTTKTNKIVGKKKQFNLILVL